MTTSIETFFWSVILCVCCYAAMALGYFLENKLVMLVGIIGVILGMVGAATTWALNK